MGLFMAFWVSEIAQPWQSCRVLLVVQRGTHRHRHHTTPPPHQTTPDHTTTTPHHTTPHHHHTTPHHTTPHHTTPHHTTPHHTTPHHTTPHHTASHHTAPHHTTPTHRGVAVIRSSDPVPSPCAVLCPCWVRIPDQARCCFRGSRQGAGGGWRGGVLFSASVRVPSSKITRTHFHDDPLAQSPFFPVFQMPLASFRIASSSSLLSPLLHKSM